MPQDICSSKAPGSSLANRFALRVSGMENARAAISSLVTALVKENSRAHNTNLEVYFRQRHILELIYKHDLECDGYIQPLGLSFADGFRVTINHSLPATRLRFTLAHELCHTFFYEHVPEMKFVPHEIDEAEERLCNFGAAELLMPVRLVTKMAHDHPVCLHSLEVLASRFGVSLEAMLVRLRSLRLWNAELSFWTQGKSGSFVSEQVGGINTAQWTWRGNELINTWETGKPSTGKTFVEYADPNGSLRVKPICYEMQRRHRRILVLHGTWSMPSKNEVLPLFTENEKMAKHREVSGFPPLAAC